MRRASPPSDDADPGPGRNRFLRRPVAPLLVSIALGLLLLAWAGSNPPGFAPDEQVHQVKAIGAGTGQWRGDPGQLPVLAFGDGPGKETREAWINAATRAFDLPEGLDPYTAGYPCQLFENDKPVTCLNGDRPRAPAVEGAVAYVGTYVPYLYAISGVVMVQMDEAREALYAGRTVNAVLVAALLSLACLTAWDRNAGLLSVSGVLLAATPTTLFLGSALGTNGLEISASLCLLTIALRSGRPGEAPSWAWPGAAFAGLLLATSRSTGPAWVVVAGAIAVYQVGPRGAWRAVAARPRRALPALAVIAAGLLATAAWEVLYQPHPGVDLAVAREGLRQLPSDVTVWAHQWVGIFGWSSLSMPKWSTSLWLVAVVALVSVALAVASSAQRRLLALVLAGTTVLGIALDVLVFQQTRFPVFGRYLLALVVVVPLAAGEVLTRQSFRIPARVRRAAPLGLAVLVATVHVVALWANARRYAVGTSGPAMFIGRSQWVPPGGWQPWAVLMLAAAASLVAAGVLSVSHRSQDAPEADRA